MIYLTMFNLNLLPEKEKQNIAWDKRTNQILYFGLFTVVSVVIFLVLLFPSYIFLALQNDDIARNLELEEKSQKTLQTKEIENRLTAINAGIQRILHNNTSVFTPGSFIERLNQLAQGRVLLTQIQYQQTSGGIQIAGWAQTRSDFLDFKNALETSKEINNIISPINNVIKETNIQFTLSGTIQNP